ncbi:MAG: hypothetical protein H6564_11520 [Lewinellaceae bacterium]|nr:hypothetical protein [Lewinellaceae bacterium]
MKRTIFMALLFVFSYSVANAQKGQERTPMQEYEQVKPSLGLSKKQEKKLEAVYQEQQKEFEAMQAERGKGRKSDADVQGKNGERPQPPADGQKPEMKEGRKAPADVQGNDSERPQPPADGQKPEMKEGRKAPANGAEGNKKGSSSGKGKEMQGQGKHEQFEAKVKEILTDEQFNQWKSMTVKQKH